jgi:hypothetical protein
VFHRRRFFDGKGERLLTSVDAADGRRMTRRDWENTNARVNGGLPQRGRAADGGAPWEEPRRLVPAAFNAHYEDIFPPARRFGTRWEIELVTGDSSQREDSRRARTSRSAALGRRPARMSKAPRTPHPPDADAGVSTIWSTASSRTTGEPARGAVPGARRMELLRVRPPERSSRTER